MLTLLGSLLGFAGSAIPEVINTFKEDGKHKHDLEVMKLQLEAAKNSVKLEKEVYAFKALDEEQKRLLEHDANIDSRGFVGALRGSVRPIITYVFFLTFIAVKGSAMYVMLQSGTDIPAALDAVWDNETEALFAAVISFWFGSRAISKLKGKT